MGFRVLCSNGLLEAPCSNEFLETPCSNGLLRGCVVTGFRLPCSNGFLKVPCSNKLYKRLLLGFLGFAHKVNEFGPFCGDFAAQFW